VKRLSCSFQTGSSNTGETRSDSSSATALASVFTRHPYIRAAGILMVLAGGRVTSDRRIARSSVTGSPPNVFSHESRDRTRFTFPYSFGCLSTTLPCTHRHGIPSFSLLEVGPPRALYRPLGDLWCLSVPIPFRVSSRVPCRGFTNGQHLRGYVQDTFDDLFFQGTQRNICFP
jgi:hypothetical protein